MSTRYFPAFGITSQSNSLCRPRKWIPRIAMSRRHLLFRDSTSIANRWNIEFEPHACQVQTAMQPTARTLFTNVQIFAELQFRTKEIINNSMKFHGKFDTLIKPARKKSCKDYSFAIELWTAYHKNDKRANNWLITIIQTKNNAFN